MVQSAISIVWVKYSRPQCIVSECFGLSRRSLEKPPSPCQDRDVLGYFFGKALLHNLALHLELVSENSGSRKTPDKHSEWVGRTRTRWSRSKLTLLVQNTRLVLDFAKFPSVFGSWIKILRVQQNPKVAVPCSPKQIALHIQLRRKGTLSSPNTTVDRNTHIGKLSLHCYFLIQNTLYFVNENSWHVSVYPAGWK